MPKPTQTPAQIAQARAQAAQGDPLQEVRLKDGTLCWLHPCLKEHPQWPQIAEAMGVAEWVAH